MDGYPTAGGGSASQGPQTAMVQCMLLERNGGMAGGDGSADRWINLGVHPEVHPYMNLWCRIPHGFGQRYQGGGGGAWPPNTVTGGASDLGPR